MEPLASLLRPKKLEDYIGQKHLVGVGKPLRVAIEKKHPFSFILWGPPGVGKTTLARMYAKALNVDYHELSAVSAGKDDIRKILEGGNLFGPKILFLDEIHRFNKAQQDFLLPHVENGNLILIGATTENPSFEVIPALLSRARVFILNSLTEENLREIISRVNKTIDKEAEDWLLRVADGDARQMLAIIEHTLELYSSITVEHLESTIQSTFLRYDKKGEDHYNTISAFIKSMRAGKQDAAMYYLSRMIASGEDAKFIARRMVIFASEDIGMADSQALVIANEVFKAVEVIGLPECGINLAHGVTYLARAKKDRSAYDAYAQALSDAKMYGNLPIPLTLRNAPTKLMKESGYGDGYEMYGEDSYMPEKLDNKKYF
jgi:putative ATPase